MTFDIGKYRIDLEPDKSFSVTSIDNINQYHKIYFTESDYVLPTKIGLNVFQDEALVTSAIIGSIGGGTGIHKRSQIIENDRILVCCSDSIFCLSIPDLDLLWKIQADQSTCFGIYKKDDFYIIHGEMEISKLNNNGEIIWQQGGADIFTTVSGNDNFQITDTYIRTTDWENREYKFDFNGNDVG